MNAIHRLEPLWWMLFGAGGFVAALFLPGLLLGVCVLAPLGLIDGLEYERASALASSPLGKATLAVILSLTVWHCAHHLRHLTLDLTGPRVAAAAAWGCYGIALLLTVVTVGLAVLL